MYEIGYAYSTSTFAEEAGQGKTGCFFVRKSDPAFDSLIFHAPTWQECRDYVDENNLPESRWSMKHHPSEKA